MAIHAVQGPFDPLQCYSSLGPPSDVQRSQTVSVLSTARRKQCSSEPTTDLNINIVRVRKS